MNQITKKNFVERIETMIDSPHLIISESQFYGMHKEEILLNCALLSVNRIRGGTVFLVIKDQGDLQRIVDLILQKKTVVPLLKFEGFNGKSNIYACITFENNTRLYVFHLLKCKEIEWFYQKNFIDCLVYQRIDFLKKQNEYNLLMERLKSNNLQYHVNQIELTE